MFIYRRSDRIEEMFQRFVAGRSCFPVFGKTGKTSGNSDFRDAFMETEKIRQNFLKFLLADNCGQLCSTGWKTFTLCAWWASGTGFRVTRTPRENVDRTTGSPIREAVQWWCCGWARSISDHEGPAGGLMRSRNDPRRREDGGGPQVEELCKRRSAKRGGRGRLAAGGGAAQVPEGGRRGWPYRGFIVCVG